MMKKTYLLVVLALLVAMSGGVERHSSERIVEIRIHHSSFTPQHLVFQRGDRVRFVVINTDPIDHELIVGDEEVQKRHENGSEPFHGDIPGEVTVLAGETAQTTYVFEEPGTLFFACHFPGHYAYGMKGTITVR
jgi:uncharacterized cupredoxin-like copper-binding protein